MQYIDDTLPPESPYLYGLHPNAEIGFLTQSSEKLFRVVLEMQPRDSSMGEGGVVTREETVRVVEKGAVFIGCPAPQQPSVLRSVSQLLAVTSSAFARCKLGV